MVTLASGPMTSTSIHKATKITLLQILNRLPAKPCPFDHSHIYVAERLPKSALDWIRCSISNSLIWLILPFRSTFIPLILSLPTPPTLHCKGIAWSHGHIPHHSNCGIHTVKQNFTVSSWMDWWEKFYSPLYLTFLNPQYRKLQKTVHIEHLYGWKYRRKKRIFVASTDMSPWWGSICHILCSLLQLVHISH